MMAVLMMLMPKDNTAAPSAAQHVAEAEPVPAEAVQATGEPQARYSTQSPLGALTTGELNRQHMRFTALSHSPQGNRKSQGLTQQ